MIRSGRIDIKKSTRLQLTSSLKNDIVTVWLNDGLGRFATLCYSKEVKVSPDQIVEFLLLSTAVKMTKEKKVDYDVVTLRFDDREVSFNRFHGVDGVVDLFLKQLNDLGRLVQQQIVEV